MNRQTEIARDFLAMTNLFNQQLNPGDGNSIAGCVFVVMSDQIQLPDVYLWQVWADVYLFQLPWGCSIMISG